VIDIDMPDEAEEIAIETESEPEPDLEPEPKQEPPKAGRPAADKQQSALFDQEEGPGF
jgi:hypothetical protein